MKMTMVSIVIDALGIVTIEFVQILEELEIKRRGETIQTTALFRSARIQRSVLEIYVGLLSQYLL